MGNSPQLFKSALNKRLSHTCNDQRVRCLKQQTITGLTFLFLFSCGQNSNITLSHTRALTNILNLSLNAASSFNYTYDQQNSLPDISWQLTDNSTGAPYNGTLSYSYAVGSVAVGSLPGASSNESSLKAWTDTGSTAPSLGAGVQGLNPGIYYMNIQAIDPATGAVVATDNVRFEVLSSSDTQAAVAMNGPSSGSSTSAGAAETVTGTCSPNGSTVTVSGSDLTTSATGTCNAGTFSIPVTMNSSLVAGSQPQINVSIGTATAAAVLSVPTTSAPSVAITGPSTSSYIQSLGMGATSPLQQLAVSCTNGDSINVSGELSGVSPSLPALCPVSGILNFSFSYADNGASGATGPRLVQVSATNNAGLSSYDSATYYRAPGAPSITSPATSSTIGLLSTVSGACTEGATVSISSTNLSPNPTTGLCASDNTYSIPIQFTALTTGAQTLSATQTINGITSTATSRSVTVDNSQPSLTLSQSSPYLGHNGSSSFVVDVNFSESVSGLSAGDFVIGGGTATLNPASGPAQNYTLTITPTGTAPITIDLPASTAQSTASGNGNTAATQLSIPYDNVIPTLSFSSTVGTTTNTSPIPITVTFSEAVLASTVSSSDYTVNSGSIGNFSCLPTPSSSYTSCSFDVSGMTPNSNLVVAVNSTATVSDLAQNLSTAPNSASLSISYDTTPPSLEITSPATINNSNKTAYSVTGTCSEIGRTVDVTIGSISVTPSPLCAAGGTWITPSVDVSALSDGTVSITATQTDAAGNTASATPVDATKDTSAPTITSVLATSGFPAIGNTIGSSTTSLSVDISFSENMATSGTGAITSADFAATNATISSVTCASATLCSVLLDTSASTNGTISLSLASSPAAIIQDTAANNLSGSMTSTSWTLDSVPPTLSFSSTVGTATNTSPIPITVTFSEAVLASTVSSSDFTVNSGSIGNFSCLPTPSSSYTSCSFDVSGMTPNSNLVVAVNSTATVSDLAQNLSTAPNSASLSISYDTTPPSLEITSPATINNSNKTAYSVTGTCSEIGRTVDVTIGSISVTPSPLCAAGGTWITPSVDVSALSDGTVSITATQTDAAGNTASATPVDASKDTSAPTITSVLATSGFPAIGNTIGSSTTSLSVDISFSENMATSGTGAITSADFAATNATISSVTCASATLCSVLLDTSASTNGTISLSLASSPAAIIQDTAANNLSGSMTSTSWTLDSVPPTATISSTASSPTALDPIPITVTFSEAINVSSVALTDFTVTGGTALNLSCSGTPSICTFDVNPSGATVTVQLPAASVEDLVANENLVSNTFSINTLTCTPDTFVFTTSGAGNMLLTRGTQSLNENHRLTHSAGGSGTGFAYDNNGTYIYSPYTWSTSGTLTLETDCREDLKSIYAYNSNISSLPDFRGGITSLIFNYNNISSLSPTVFSEIPNLETLYLNSNLLTNLNSNIFLNNKALRNLALSNNLLTEVDPDWFEFGGLSNALYNVDLSYNHIAGLDNSDFNNNPQLAYLYLQNNTTYFTYVEPNSFDNNPNLYTLYLGNNSLADLDSNIFLHNRALYNLSLNANQLSDIDPDWFEFGGLSNALYSVDLSYNHISGIDNNDFNNNPTLTYLSINSNTSYLTYVQPNSFDNNPNLYMLYLPSNSLNSTSVDNVFISVETHGTSNRYIYANVQSPAAPPTMASDTARANLTSRGWYIYHD